MDRYEHLRTYSVAFELPVCEVTIENREDGTVSVQAYDSQTGVELNQVFGRDADGGLSHLASQRALVRSTFINNG
ncbi:MAG: hypothetical protein IPN03_21100 [Holophagales bacterium]|nr:hypothetical protein [Holophagales bacterium]